MSAEKITDSRPRNKQIDDEIEGAKCICGLYKDPKAFFCSDCHSELPASLRIPLHRARGDAFYRAYEDAADHIKYETNRCA